MTKISAEKQIKILSVKKPYFNEISDKIKKCVEICSKKYDKICPIKYVLKTYDKIVQENISLTFNIRWHFC